MVPTIGLKSVAKESADAKIIPDKGQVAIRRDADMLPFKNARLTIDTLNGYHNLINGNIQIVSKKILLARGDPEVRAATSGRYIDRKVRASFAYDDRGRIRSGPRLQDGSIR